MTTPRAHNGFTLVEVMTAVSVFLLFMTIAMGAILGIFDASKKSRAQSTTMANLSLTIESMAREARYGSSYHCGLSGTLTEAQNCPAGDTAFAFLDNDGVSEIVYRFSGSTIYKSIDGGAHYTAVTAPEFVIEDVSFYVLGAGAQPTNNLQPKVLIKIKGYSGDVATGGIRASSRTEFTLQTLVSQRRIDNGL